MQQFAGTQFCSHMPYEENCRCYISLSVGERLLVLHLQFGSLLEFLILVIFNKSLSLNLGRQAENVPALYHYPRLCIIQHQDHQHAAFYPPIEEMQRLGTKVQARLDQITSQQIIKFVQDYLKDPAALIVKTEFF